MLFRSPFLRRPAGIGGLCRMPPENDGGPKYVSHAGRLQNRVDSKIKLATRPARTRKLQFRMPTARDATSAIVASEMADSAIISIFALTVSGNVSAGENAVAFV